MNSERRADLEPARGFGCGRLRCTPRPAAGAAGCRRGACSWHPLEYMTKRVGAVLDGRTGCRLPGLVRGRLHSAISRAMKPRSGSASLAETSWFTWSKRVKWCNRLGRSVADRFFTGPAQVGDGFLDGNQAVPFARHAFILPWSPDRRGARSALRRVKRDICRWGRDCHAESRLSSPAGRAGMGTSEEPLRRRFCRGAGCGVVFWWTSPSGQPAFESGGAAARRSPKPNS